MYKFEFTVMNKCEDEYAINVLKYVCEVITNKYLVPISSCSFNTTFAKLNIYDLSLYEMSYEEHVKSVILLLIRY